MDNSEVKKILSQTCKEKKSAQMRETLARLKEKENIKARKLLEMAMGAAQAFKLMQEKIQRDINKQANSVQRK